MVARGKTGVHLYLCALAVLMFSLLAPIASAQTIAPAQSAETIRVALADAQFALSNTAESQAALETAQSAYTGAFAETIAAAAPDADQRVKAGLSDAEQALTANDARALADARAQVWTALLAGSYRVIETALAGGDAAKAQQWLPLREFRPATRFTRPKADATIAIDGVVAGSIQPAEAVLSVRADLLDTYQARLNEALHDLADADSKGFATRRTEYASLAQGYFAILAPFYAEQRGGEALAALNQSFAALRTAARDGSALDASMTAITEGLRGFRAAPLSAEDQTRRAGQMLRFLALVPVEYGRGVSQGVVTRDLEIREAITFRDGAAAAFGDLQSLLEARDSAQTQQIAQQFAELEQMLTAAGAQTQVADPATVQTRTDDLTNALKAIMPEEWQKRDSAGDFDVIASVLDQMEQAAVTGQYELAESARLEAYAVLETGPEARLIAFAPQAIPPIEELFWYGQGDHKGLAHLISQRAPSSEIKASRQALDLQLAEAQKSLTKSGAPAAVATNAAIIVFREGLEAVLILASLMGSLKMGESRKLRRPLWWGALAALGASVLTWIFMRGVLQSFARYGERLEAVVSLIAIGVLLLITNWFFHKVYWTGWMANFHAQKKRIIGGQAGLYFGLIALGFSSIYREGFETVLFLQALVLEAGTAVVLGGVALGMAGVLLIGVLVFALQAKLPHKKMLIVTGVMIGGVLLVMVGNTAHVLQIVGWLTIHPIRWLTLPYWTGLWFGVFATWEG
ncbi:MAG: FTR1 family protein, partial [Chloroflexi bacterium]|nr:FTR1 family protein [Chloroflexota bacterium]